MASGNAGEGYSLWLIPAKPLYSTLKEKILELGSNYNAPEFEPHMTLVGNIRMGVETAIANTKALAAGMARVPGSFSGLGNSEDYFKCVYIEIKKTDYLMRYNREARKVFGTVRQGTYEPHISLIYGWIPATKRKEISEGLHIDAALKFPFDALSLYSTEGQVGEWSEAARFVLKPST